tara:strand:- start:6285 stop:6815 length:531 start_codon:yes stop_codon:yes gene_type:complete
MGLGQTKLETRLYEVNYNDLPLNPDAGGNGKYLNIQDLLGFEGRYIIHPYAKMSYDCGDAIYFYCEGAGGNVLFSNNTLETAESTLNCSESGTDYSWENGIIMPIYHTVSSTSLGSCWDGDIELWITAEFPQDETPYTQADLDNAYYEGAQSGDVSGDGVLNVMDLVQYINMILDF